MRNILNPSNIEERLEEVRARIDAIIADSEFIQSGIRTLKKIPPELLLAFPAAALAIPELQDPTEDNARKYAIVGATAWMSSNLGTDSAFILGRKMVRNLHEGERFAALKNAAQSLRASATTAAGMAIIVEALQSVPQQKAFDAAAKFVGLPDVNNAILTGAIIGGIATELVFIAGGAVEGLDIINQSEAMQSARAYARLVAQRAVEGSRNCLISLLGGEEQVAVLMNRMELVADRMARNTIRALTMPAESDLAFATVIAGIPSAESKDANMAKKTFAMMSDSTAMYKSLFKAAEAGVEMVNGLSQGDMEKVMKEIQTGLMASLVVAYGTALMVSILESIPQQRAFNKAAEAMGFSDVENPMLQGAILGGITAGLCFAMFATMRGAAVLSEEETRNAIARVADRALNGAYAGVYGLAAGVNYLIAPADRIAVAQDDHEGDLEAAVVNTTVNNAVAGNTTNQVEPSLDPIQEENEEELDKEIEGDVVLKPRAQNFANSNNIVFPTTNTGRTSR